MIARLGDRLVVGRQRNKEIDGKKMEFVFKITFIKKKLNISLNFDNLYMVKFFEKLI